MFLLWDVIFLLYVSPFTIKLFYSKPIPPNVFLVSAIKYKKTTIKLTMNTKAFYLVTKFAEKLFYIQFSTKKLLYAANRPLTVNYHVAHRCSTQPTY